MNQSKSHMTELTAEGQAGVQELFGNICGSFPSGDSFTFPSTKLQAKDLHPSSPQSCRGAAAAAAAADRGSDESEGWIEGWSDPFWRHEEETVTTE